MTTTAINATATSNPTAAQDTLALVGRVLLALLFVPAGFSKLMGFAGTVGYISSVGAPLPQVAAVIAIVVELGLGLMLLVGFKTRLAAVVLAVFTVAASRAVPQLLEHACGQGLREPADVLQEHCHFRRFARLRRLRCRPFQHRQEVS